MKWPPRAVQEAALIQPGTEQVRGEGGRRWCRLNHHRLAFRLWENERSAVRIDWGRDRRCHRRTPPSAGLRRNKDMVLNVSRVRVPPEKGGQGRAGDHAVCL